MEQRELTASLTDLPNEIIFQILTYLPPATVPTLQRVSQRFNELSQPLLWRYYCRTQFKYWSQHHQIQEKYRADVTKYDWKKIFSERHDVDRTATLQLNNLLSSQTSRLDKSESIVEHGYDVKDSLLRHLHVDDNAEDVLARRYYSDAVLGFLHRKMAIEEWVKLKDGQSVPLERALAAFDMLVLHEREGDFDDVSTRLDHLAQEIRADMPDLAVLSPRNKAVLIATCMRAHNLIGVKSDDHYHDLQNNFIGIALQHENHQSLPLISVAIYCCVAQRLGLDAHACSFPFHVHAVIKPAGGHDLEGSTVEHGSRAQPMYMDPFRTDVETPVSNLKSQLFAMGVPESDHSTLLDASTTAEIIGRTARNIMASVQMIPRNPSSDLSAVLTLSDMDIAFYGALWAQLLLAGGNQHTASISRARFLPYVLEHMEKKFPMDVGLVEEYILPLIENPEQSTQLRDIMAKMRSADTMPKAVKRRTRETAGNVRYKIGQLFQHKRYHYYAVTTGWDAKCEADEDWMSHMGVHRLLRGRNQSFYHALVDDKSVRYVAEENIEIVKSGFSSSMMALAGQHFKRWDEATNMFVSNIRDEYPDD